MSFVPFLSLFVFPFSRKFFSFVFLDISRGLLFLRDLRKRTMGAGGARMEMSSAPSTEANSSKKWREGEECKR